MTEHEKQIEDLTKEVKRIELEITKEAGKGDVRDIFKLFELNSLLLEKAEELLRLEMMPKDWQ